LPYRPPRRGDLLHVHTVARPPHQAVIGHVDDDGRTLTLTAGGTTVWWTRIGPISEETAVSWLTDKIDEAKQALERLFGHDDAEVKAVAAQVASKLDQAKHAAEADVETLAKDAAGDAKTVAGEAATELKPAGTAAEQDAAHLATQAARDVQGITDGAQ
jgi:hypothetical protein